MNERAKLLHSLTIERADAKVSPPRRRLWPVVAATSFGVIVVMVGLVWYFAPETRKPAAGRAGRGGGAGL